MKKLYNLKMKEGASVAEHLNAFNIITNQLASVKIILDDEIRAILLMCSMPDSWENLIVAMSTSTTTGTLKFDDVSSSLMNEELRRKSIAENQGGEALALADRGRRMDRGRQGRSRSRGRSKSRRGRIICFHCGKPGHMKKECRFWKKGQKDQRPSSTNHKSSSTNEGETTVVATDGDVLFTVSVEDACVYTSSSSFDWILDSGASHHVTPCKDSFVSYNPGDYGRVHLGNNHFCSIVGVGDVQIKMKDG
jgi:hypothetical protein